jgi:hypothetical protein
LASFLKTGAKNAALCGAAFLRKTGGCAAYFTGTSSVFVASFAWAKYVCRPARNSETPVILKKKVAERVGG